MNFVLRTLLLTASTAQAVPVVSQLDQLANKYVALVKEQKSLIKLQMDHKADDAFVLKTLSQYEVRIQGMTQELDAIKPSTPAERDVVGQVRKDFQMYGSMIRSETAFIKNPTKENFAVYKKITTDWLEHLGSPHKKADTAATDPQISKDLHEWALNFEPHLNRYLLFVKALQTQAKPTSQDFATVQHMRDDFKEDARKFLLIKPTANRNDAEMSQHCSQDVRAAYLSTLYLAQLLQGKGDPGQQFLENNFIANAGYIELTFAMRAERDPASVLNPLRAQIFYKDMLLHSAQVDALAEKPENEALLNSLFLETFNLESKGKALPNTSTDAAAKGFMKSIALERDAYGYLQAFHKSHDPKKNDQFKQALKASRAAFAAARISALMPSNKNQKGI